MTVATQEERTSWLPGGLRVRPYEQSDFDAVWRLHIEGVQVTRDRHKIDYSQHETDLHNIETTYLMGGGFWVVEAADGLIGMAAVQRIVDRTGRLRRMRVTERWRRHGVAEALLAACEGFCRESGFSRIILDTMEQQTAAQALYEKAGFRRTGERDLGPFHIFDYEKDVR
jgi:ribosomal protein S18 acetylase RimI-like enzyme